MCWFSELWVSCFGKREQRSALEMTAEVRELLKDEPACRELHEVFKELDRFDELERAKQKRIPHAD